MQQKVNKKFKKRSETFVVVRSAESSHYLASCCSNLGYLVSISFQSSRPFDRFRMTSPISLTCNKWSNDYAVNKYLFRIFNYFRHTGIRTCCMESRSRSVTLLGSFNVSKSMVIPYGIAISSVRAYRRPMDPLELSTLCDTSFWVNVAAKCVVQIQLSYFHRIQMSCLYVQICWMNGASSELLLSGSTEHLIGATTGGSEM